MLFCSVLFPIFVCSSIAFLSCWLWTDAEKFSVGSRKEWQKHETYSWYILFEFPSPLKKKRSNKNNKKQMLCFDLWPGPPKNAIPRWCTGRKWDIPMAVWRGNRVGGNWLMKWDKVFHMIHNRVMHQKRVTSELHDSYFRLMTIKHSISKIEWASNDYIIELSSGSSWIRLPGEQLPVEFQTARDQMW